MNPHGYIADLGERQHAVFEVCLIPALIISEHIILSGGAIMKASNLIPFLLEFGESPETASDPSGDHAKHPRITIAKFRMIRAKTRDHAAHIKVAKICFTITHRVNAQVYGLATVFMSRPSVFKGLDILIVQPTGGFEVGYETLFYIGSGIQSIPICGFQHV